MYNNELRTFIKYHNRASVLFGFLIQWWQRKPEYIRRSGPVPIVCQFYSTSSFKALGFYNTGRQRWDANFQQYL
jgi:hypothetical protein